MSESMEQKRISRGHYTGERPLFHEKGLKIEQTIFGEGESPLKECKDIEMTDSSFEWKYPLCAAWPRSGGPCRRGPDGGSRR